MPESTDILASGQPAVELVDVAVPSQYESSGVILEGVNWQVRGGDFWAIGGLAHSGKTNLMMVAAGVLRPARGAYRLLGKDFTGGFERANLAYRLKIGMVFDGGQLLQHLTLGENVALPLRYHVDEEAKEEPTRRRLAALLEFTGLADWGNLRPASVNRTWQQRFGLARALALKPQVLLLDSPLTGLDPRNAAWWLETLAALASGHPIMEGRPLTLAVTGDDLRPWRKLARQFAVVREGAFIGVGSGSEMALHPEPLLRELLPGVGSGT